MSKMTNVEPGPMAEPKEKPHREKNIIELLPESWHRLYAEYRLPIQIGIVVLVMLFGYHDCERAGVIHDALDSVGIPTPVICEAAELGPSS